MSARAGHASRRGLGLALSSMLLATPLAAGATEPLAPFEFPRQAAVPKPEASASSAVCGFADLALPADAVVYAAGAYAGRKAGFQIDQSGHEATRIDVAVNSPGRPVALMLGAYEPTVWHIGWSPGTRILAVLVSGYHRQAVAGLPPAVPLLNSSYDNRGPCGYFYVAESRLAELNPMAPRRCLPRTRRWSNRAFRGNVAAFVSALPSAPCHTPSNTRKATAAAPFSSSRTAGAWPR